MRYGVPHLVLSKRAAVLIVYGLVPIVLIADLLVPEDLDLAVFYALSIAACTWVGSRRLLWAVTATAIVLAFADMVLGAPPVTPNNPQWLYVANRVCVAAALLVLATFVHVRLRTVRLLEESRGIVERQNEQLRVAGAELERRVADRTRELEIASEQRRQAEAALHHAQKLEAVGQLTGGVAHDFNNLLTVIGGNADMLRHSVQTDRERQRVDAIMHAAELGGKLTRELLAFSRRQALQPEVLDLRERTRMLGELLARSLREDIRIAVTMPDDL